LCPVSDERQNRNPFVATSLPERIMAWYDSWWGIISLTIIAYLLIAFLGGSQTDGFVAVNLVSGKGTIVLVLLLAIASGIKLWAEWGS
jgi:hypothetical protein